MNYWLGYLDLAVIFAIFAVALNVLVGYVGIFSVASAGFGAAGGYLAADLTLRHGWPLLAALAAGVLLGAVIGLVLCYPLVRLPQEFAVLLTLSSAILMVNVITALPNLGGQQGLIGLPLPTVLGYDVSTPRNFLIFAAVLTLAVAALCWRLGESPFGRLLRAIRADELATRSLGKRTGLVKLGIFASMSGITAGAGALLVSYNELAAPTLFTFDQTTLIFAMVVIGGIASIPGSMLGALLVTLAEPVARRLFSVDATTAAQLQPIVFGALLILLTRFRPSGLVRERHRRPRPTATGSANRVAVDEPVADPAKADHEQVLQVAGLTKRFGGVVAVNDLTFDLRRGEITALIGPNGAGKSTVFNLITGALRPDAGEVTLFGHRVTGMKPERVARLGMVRSFQDVRVFAGLSAIENVMLAGQSGDSVARIFFAPRAVSRADAAQADRAYEWLHFVGVGESAQADVSALSFAQQKLVAFARVLATEAKLLLLDEPLSGLEGSAVDQLLELLERTRDMGRTICIVEHNVSAIRRLADRAYFMELGAVTASGPIEELLADTRLEEAYFGAR